LTSYRAVALKCILLPVTRGLAGLGKMSELAVGEVTKWIVRSGENNQWPDFA